MFKNFKSENGYARMARHRENAAGIASMASYPIVQASSDGNGSLGHHKHHKHHHGVIGVIEDGFEKLINLIKWKLKNLNNLNIS